LIQSFNIVFNKKVRLSLDELFLFITNVWINF
jgi:hypothetical protein